MLLFKKEINNESSRICHRVGLCALGSAELHGQGAIGNTFVGEELFSRADSGVNVARYLPYPSHSLTELLEEDPKPTPSCTEAVENQEQGLYVNRFKSGVIGEYLRRLISGELAIFQTWVDLSSPEMASVPVNQYHISRLSRLQGHSKSASIKVGQEVLV